MVMLNSLTMVKFFNAPHHLLIIISRALKYMQEKFRLADKLLINTRWIDVPKRIATEWSNVKYFLQRCLVLSGIPNDEVFDEYFDYQTLEGSEIGTQA